MKIKIYRHKNNNIDELEYDIPLSGIKTIFYLVMGGLGLWGGSELLIKGATAMALDFGVPPENIRFDDFGE